MKPYAKVIVLGSPITKSNFKLHNKDGRAILPYNTGKAHVIFELESGFFCIMRGGRSAAALDLKRECDAEGKGTLGLRYQRLCKIKLNREGTLDSWGTLQATQPIGVKLGCSWTQSAWC